MYVSTRLEIENDFGCLQKSHAPLHIARMYSVWEQRYPASLYRILLSGLPFHFCSVYDTNGIWYLVYKMKCFKDQSHIQALLFPANGVSLTQCWCYCLCKLENTRVGCLIKLYRVLRMVYDSLTSFFFGGAGELCTSSYFLTNTTFWKPAVLPSSGKESM